MGRGCLRGAVSALWQVWATPAAYPTFAPITIGDITYCECYEIDLLRPFGLIWDRDEAARPRPTYSRAHGAPRHGAVCRDGGASARRHQDGEQFRDSARDAGYRALRPTALRGG